MVGLLDAGAASLLPSDARSMANAERALETVGVWINGTGRASMGLPRTVIFVSRRIASTDTRQMLRSEAPEPAAMPDSAKLQAVTDLRRFCKSAV